MSLTSETIQTLVTGEHGDPFAVLGPHAGREGMVSVRALIPAARAGAAAAAGRRGRRPGAALPSFAGAVVDIERAALLAARKGKEAVDMADLEEAVDRQQRQRHPLHHLQLEMAVVLGVERVPGADEACSRNHRSSDGDEHASAPPLLGHDRRDPLRIARLEQDAAHVVDRGSAEREPVSQAGGRAGPTSAWERSTCSSAA